MLSPDQRILKPGLSLHGCSVLPSTLRTWRRKGYFTDIDIPPGHGHALYSFVDFATFAIARRLDRGGLPAPYNVEIAIKMRRGIRDMLENSTERKEWYCWGWTSKLGSEQGEVFFATNPMDYIELQTIFGTSQVFLLVDIASVVREVAARLDGLLDGVEP